MAAPLFPTTHATFLTLLGEEISRLVHGPEPDAEGAQAARRTLRNHLMARYREPLRVLLRAHAPSLAPDADEVVHGFLVRELAADDDSVERFLARQKASGMRLRRWMANALLFHARGVLRDRMRESGRRVADAGAMLDERPSLAPSADEAFERAWAQSIVREACARVEESLQSSTRGRNALAWSVFRRHALDGAAYATLAPEFGLREQQLADLVRGVSRRVRDEIARTLAAEGVPGPEVAAEIERLVARIASGEAP